MRLPLPWAKWSWMREISSESTAHRGGCRCCPSSASCRRIDPVLDIGRDDPYHRTIVCNASSAPRSVEADAVVADRPTSRPSQRGRSDLLRGRFLLSWVRLSRVLRGARDQVDRPRSPSPRNAVQALFVGVEGGRIRCHRRRRTGRGVRPATRSLGGSPRRRVFTRRQGLSLRQHLRRPASMCGQTQGQPAASPRHLPGADAGGR